MRRKELVLTRARSAMQRVETFYRAHDGRRACSAGLSTPSYMFRGRVRLARAAKSDLRMRTSSRAAKTVGARACEAERVARGNVWLRNDAAP